MKLRNGSSVQLTIPGRNYMETGESIVQKHKVAGKPKGVQSIKKQCGLFTAEMKLNSLLCPSNSSKQNCSVEWS